MRKTTSRPQKAPVSFETVFYIMGWCMAGVILLAAILLSVNQTSLEHILKPCILYQLTGIYCPGCGGTRAVSYLFQGDFLRAFIYHPLVFYTAAVGGWFMISQTIERLSRHRIAIGLKYHDNYLWTALVIVVLNFILKNFFLFALHIDLLAF